MERKIKTQVTGYPTVDGGGVKLIRVLGNGTAKEFDPILMLDSFDSENPDDYTAGFPLHPHRGIETVSYVYHGKMRHRDTLGNEDTVGDGEVQWMNSGSGIMHEEQIPAADRVLGVQMWLNLPSGEKMSTPTYHALKAEDIPEVEIEGGKVRVLAGSFGDAQGHVGDHLPLNYYDVHLADGAELTIPTVEDDSVMVFTLQGDARVAGELVRAKTAVKLTEGDSLRVEGVDGGSQILFMGSRALGEPIAWAGPVVMNTRAELLQAFDEIDRDEFVKEGLEVS